MRNFAILFAILSISIPCVAINDPVAHWKLDETSGLTAYDSAGSNDGTLYGGPDNGLGIPKTTLEMQTESTFTAAGWDFTTPVWKIVRESEDYPRLSWQEEIAGDFAGLWGVDYKDFAYFAGRWLDINCDTSNDCDGADLDFSTDVGPSDLLIFAEQWLEDSVP